MRLIVSLFLITLFGVILSQNIENLFKGKNFVPCKTLVQTTKTKCKDSIGETQENAKKALQLFSQITHPKAPQQENQKLMDELNKLIKKTLELAKNTKKCVIKKKRLVKHCPSICKRKQKILDGYISKLEKKRKVLSEKRCSNIKLKLKKLNLVLTNFRRFGQGFGPALQVRVNNVMKIISNMSKVFYRCEKGGPIVSCYKRVRACIHPGIPEQKRTKALKLDGKARLIQAKLDKIKICNSDSCNKLKQKSTITLVAKKNKYQAAVKRLIVPSRRQLCQKEIDNKIKQVLNEIEIKKTQLSLNKEDKIKSELTTEIQKLEKSVETLKGKRLVCLFVRSKINKPNCLFWKKKVERVKRHIKLAQNQLVTAKHEKESPAQKIKVSNLTIAIQRGINKLKQIKGNLKKCGNLKKSKKICKNCFQKCNKEKNECKKVCQKNQKENICAFTCLKTRIGCYVQCSKTKKCKRSSYEIRCKKECEESECVKKCNTNKGSFICKQKCSRKCKQGCKAKAKKYLERTNRYLICRRQNAKKRFIDLLLKKIVEKKKQTKSDRIELIEKKLLKKKELVTKNMSRYNCHKFKRSPFCSWIKVDYVCKNVDEHAKEIKRINLYLEEAQEAKKTVCKKPITTNKDIKIINKPGSSKGYRVFRSPSEGSASKRPRSKSSKGSS